MAAFNEDSSPVSIDPTGLDPLVLALGQLLGLLVVDGDSVSLDTTWFQDPLTHTRDAATQDPDALISVITQLLGQIGGNALGIAVDDPNLLGTWYPIQWAGVPTGAYMVAYTPEDAPTMRVIGLGARVTWESTVTGAVPEGSTNGVMAQIWGMIPLLSLGDGQLLVAVATAGRPMTVGASLSGLGGSDLFDGVGISLGGVRATGALDLANTADPLSLTMVFAQLQLPDASAPADISLADIEALSADQILSIVAALALSALSEAVGGSAQLDYVLPALGLATAVPQVNTPVPLLGWAEMAALVTAGQSPLQPFLTWFQALVMEPSAGAAWLTAVAGTLGGTPPATSGSGTREDPLAVEIFSSGNIGALAFTLASETGAGGVRMVYPGLRYSAVASSVSSNVALAVNATLELIQINLSSTGALSTPGPSSLSATAGFVLRNPDASQPLYQGDINGDSYRFGSVVMGVDLAAGMQLMPAFQMRDLATPNGNYAVLDLTQPEQVAAVAISELISLIVSQLTAMLGLSTDADDPFGQPVGALIGLNPPTLPSGVSWPTSLPPPLSAAALWTTMQDPVSALSVYYSSLLTTTVGGQLAFVYMLSEMGALLETVGAPTISVRGTGSITDPWRVALVEFGVAGLIAYRDSGQGAPSQLTFGLDLQSTVPLGSSNTLVLDFALDVVQLAFDPDGTPALGAWLPRLGLSAALPETLSSPPVADASVSVSQASLSVQWLAATGWGWDMVARAPTLTVGSTAYPVGSDLEFTDTAGLDALVTQQGATFAPLLVRLLGAFAARTDYPAAYALDGVLGLLPDLGPSMPEALDWPSDMPVMTPTGFTDPIAVIRGQISALTASPTYLAAAGRVVAWAFSKDGSVPPVPGAGTLADPLQVPVGLPLGLRVWSGTNGALGVGVGRDDLLSVGGLIVQTEAIIRAIEVPVNGGAVGGGAIPVPSLTLQVTVSSASGTLATSTDGSPITALVGGVCLSLDDLLNVSASPIALIQLGGQSPTTLDATQVNADQLVYESLNLAFQAVASALGGGSGFETVYAVLTDLGLTLARPSPSSPYGVTPNGWSGLVSDPTTWLGQHALATLADADSRAQLVGVVEAMFGRTTPIEIPVELNVFLAALGIVTGPATGYTLRPDAVIALAQSPVDTLVERFTSLLNDPLELGELVSALAGSTGPNPLGPLTWSVVDGAVVQLALPESAPLVIGGILEVSGTISFDLRNQTLSGSVRAYIPTIGVALAPALSWSMSAPSDAPDLTVNLTWGSDQTPSAIPLTLYPFDQDTFIDQVTVLGPTQALSSFVTLVFDPYVLQPSAVARALFSPLGLVVTAEDGSFHLKSLLGLFDDPLGWLLSDAVVGVDGKLNVAAVGTLLAGIPSGAVTGGIYIEQLGADGVEIGGLPYGVLFRMGVNSASTLVVFTSTVTGLPVGGSAPVATLDLSAQLTLDATYQPGVNGTVTVRESTTQVGVSTGYVQDTFQLSVVSPGTGPALVLMPFAGWQSLVQSLAAAMSLVLQNLMGKLLDQLAAENAQNAAFVTALRTAASPDQLDVPSLVTALATVRDASDVLTASLDWISERFSLTGAPGTVAAIQTLLDPYVAGLGSPSGEGGLLSFTPSQSIPLTLLIGRSNSDLLGVWAELDLPKTGVVQVTVPRTGAGFQTSEGWPVTFSFGLTVLAPIVDASTGPAIALTYESASGRVQLSLDPQWSGDTPSAMKVELLPSFFSDQPQGVESWLIQVLTQVLPRYASLVVLNLPPVKQWLDTPIVTATTDGGDPAPTPGDLFVGGQLFLREPPDNNYVLNSLDALLALPPADFVGGFLKALLEKEIKVLSLGTNGGIFLGSSPTYGYGVRLYAPDMALTSLPTVTFQIGADDTQWISEAGGGTTPRPGVSIYVPIPDTTPLFDQTTLGLVNIGLDVHGADQAPLVQLSRFELGEVSPRFLGLFNFADLGNPVIGGALSVENMGFAVAPDNLSSGPNLNPVAANMLGSGSPSQPDAKNPPTNPTLSARVAYVTELSAGFIDAAGDLTDQVIVQVQQSFGPLSVSQVGFGWDNDTEILSFLFSGGLDVGPLAMAVMDLSVQVPVTDPTNYDGYGMDLAGVAVSFTTSSVLIAGALLKYSDPVRYDGVVLLKVGTFSLTAAGSYTTIEEDPPNAEPTSPSFFVFVASGTPIGGPPAFFVRGLSAGFGYNRSLLLPTAAEVPDYLLVQGSLDPAAVFGSDPTPSSALEKLAKDVKPEVGAYWLAAGVHFTTYALLDSVGLLVVTFGNSFSIGLLGVSRLTLPPLVSSASQALLYVELGLSLTIQPSVGLVAATAQLTPNSFVLDKACKLTGGFAFYMWWSPNAHAGDFVLTVGGYNANYTPPDHYPVVPRLGLSWPMSSPIGSISIVGNAYFALTPNAVMAGGLLDLQFVAGPLRAWFTASADFLIAWKPFYYDIRIQLSIGVAFTTTLFGVSVTLKAELGAGLELWGPPTAGVAHVSWYVISFSIPIGDQDKDLDTQMIADWATFEANFLPPPGDSQPPASLAQAGPARVSAALDETPQQNVLKLSMPVGQVAQAAAGDGGVAPADPSVWTINRVGFSFRAETPVPLSSVVAGTVPPLSGSTGGSVGVRPMAVSALESTMTYTLTAAGQQQPFPIDDATFGLSAYNASGPMALWDAAPFDNGAAPSTPTTLPGLLLGATLSGDDYEDINPVGPIDLSIFDTEQLGPLDLPLSASSPYTPADPYPASDQKTALARLMATIMDESTVVPVRNGILATLRSYSLVAPGDPNLSVMATRATNVFQAPPVLARLSETLAPSVSMSAPLPARAAPTQAAAPAPQGPALVAMARRYTVPGAPTSALDPSAGRTFARSLSPSQLSGLAAGVPTLHDGAVAIWSVDGRARHTLSLSGVLPLDVLCFDRRGELTHSETALAGARATSRAALPLGTTRVALVGALDGEIHTAGWSRSTPLMRLSSRVLLGERCLVRPQGLVQGRDIAPHGIVSPAEMLGASMVKGRAGVSTGWITTMLPPNMDRVHVFVSGDGRDVEIALLTRQDNKLRREAVTQAVARDVEGGVVLSVDVTGRAVDGWIRVMVRPARAEQLRAVMGVAATREAAAPAALGARATTAVLLARLEGQRQRSTHATARVVLDERQEESA